MLEIFVVAKVIFVIASTTLSNPMHITNSAWQVTILSLLQVGLIVSDIPDKTTLVLKRSLCLNRLHHKLVGEP